MQINTALLRELRDAHRTQASISAGLMAQVIAAERWSTTCAGRLANARERAAYGPRGRPDAGVSESDHRQAAAIAAQQRYQAEDALRHQLRGQPGAFQQIMSETQQATASDFQQAVDAAESDCRAAEAEIARLVEAQGKAGSRAGELSGTLQEGAAWLVEHGHAGIVAELRI